MQAPSADFSRVPVVEVGTDNLAQTWPSMLLAVKSATFIAIDLELSGLGDRRQINAKSIEDRYKAMCDVARTRSIVSLGLSCFKLVPPQTTESSEQDKRSVTNFSVQTFNILVLCSENYVVEPLSLKFLVDHGFDFNTQYATGLPYYRGRDKDGERPGQCVRQLFTELVASGVPVVFHNALVDLVFIYHSFYANLPAQMSTFLADLSEVFSGGIFDTKYITEFKARFQASYLGYVFRKCQRENCTRDKAGQPSARLTFLSYPASMSSIIYMSCSLDTETPTSSPPKVCRHYASHGWCAQGSACPNSHNIDLILDNEAKGTTAKKRKHKHRHRTGDASTESSQSPGHAEDIEADIGTGSGSDSMDVDDLPSNSTSNAVPEENPKLEGEHNGTSEAKSKQFAAKQGGHRAGYDAFMTGFTFAVYIAKFGTSESVIAASDDSNNLGMEAFRSMVSLSGKDIPLQILKSNFAKTSREHREKIVKLKPEEDT